MVQRTHIIITLLVVTVLMSFPTYAFAHPRVTMEHPDTGSPELDKQINSFYDCLSRTHEDPPTLQQTDDCYNQTISVLHGHTDDLNR